MYLKENHFPGPKPVKYPLANCLLKQIEDMILAHGAQNEYSAC